MITQEKQIEKKYTTNEEMQELCDQHDAYMPIDEDGNLQCFVDDTTEFIVDCDADELMRYRKSEDEMMVIMDRRGKKYYPTTINPWW